MAFPIPFDYNQFIIDYPEFAGYSENRLTNIFNNQASVMSQPVSALFCDINEQYYWVCMTLAHIMYRRATGVTGRANHITQGSESIAFELNSPKWAAYWDTSPYGQEIAQTIAMYLSGGHYVSNGEIPYEGQSMNGMYALDWVGW